MTEIKPLNWTPKPGVGMSVVRRGDGGLTLTFTDLSDNTLADWREFAMEHLMGLSGRTRNLYDLRAVKEIPEQAVRAAVDASLEAGFATEDVSRDKPKRTSEVGDWLAEYILGGG